MPENQSSQNLTADSLLVEIVRPSPNFGDRATGKALDMLVLHYTGMEKAEGALAWLSDEQSQVSAHYFIFENGRIAQMVCEDKRAWHAGQSSWRQETDINSRSIGIEIANPGHEFGYVDFPDVQMESVVKLVSDIVQRRNIPADGIVAHSDIAPLRKEDPGERFDWQLLHQHGLGIWVAPEEIVEGEVMQLGDKGENVKAFQIALAELGFEVSTTGEFDDLTEACVIAFQRRYRPKLVDGIGDVSTFKTLKRILAAQ